MRLTNESETLISYFTKNKCVDSPTTNKHTTEILKKMYSDIYNANKFILNLKNKYGAKFYVVKSKIIKSASQITKPITTGFNSFPSQIREQINALTISELHYTFSLFGRKIKIYFILEHKYLVSEIDNYNRYVDSILTWLFLLDRYGGKTCASSSLSLYFYFTSLKKQLPKSSIDVLDKIHVNTAFTQTCQRDAEIIVFRKEEWFKVFLHETFHTFALDFSGMDNASCNLNILKTFDVQSEVNLYEAYTEFWAEILNAVFCSFHSLHEKEDTKLFLMNCDFFINVERTYSFFQLVKTLDFMKLTYKNLYSKNKRDTELRSTYYKEKTNVLSYYIIKTILINNYQLFLNWCYLNNTNIIQFTKTEMNIEKFCLFINKQHRTILMLKNIELTEKCYHNFIKHYSKHKSSINYLLTNMRMSICELG